jgi:hypothetical protein
LHNLDRDRIINAAIVIGIFGGLVGGPILSLADYNASPERRFWTFIVPEFIGFGCLILMIIFGKSKQKKKKIPSGRKWQFIANYTEEEIIIIIPKKSSKKVQACVKCTVPFFALSASE